jgi:hypothetical protein
MHYLSVLNGITSFEESKSILENLGLIIKEYNDLYLVKYEKSKSQMDHEDVRKCRGVILEKNTNKLVCISPQKSIDVDFYHKKYIENNSNDVIIEEFYDGTMINMFKHNGVNYVSTRSCLGAHNKYRSIKTFNTMFSECIDFEVFDKLDGDYCYSFLLQHPDNKIVKQYDVPSCILTMTTKINENNSVSILNNVETVELLSRCNVIIQTPRVFNIDSMDNLYKELDSLNETDQGYVLKFYENGSNNRSKIRNMKYNEIRQLRGNDTNKMFMYFELRKQQNIVEYLEYFPEDKDLFDRFRHELYAFTQRLFNYYQELKVRKNIRFLEIDYEFRPLINELHAIYTTTNRQITKNIVINYLHNLNSARILFVLNYGKKNREQSSETESDGQTMISATEFPLLSN